MGLVSALRDRKSILFSCFPVLDLEFTFEWNEISSYFRLSRTLVSVPDGSYILRCFVHLRPLEGDRGGSGYIYSHIIKIEVGHVIS